MGALREAPIEFLAQGRSAWAFQPLQDSNLWPCTYQRSLFLNSDAACAVTFLLPGGFQRLGLSSKSGRKSDVLRVMRAAWYVWSTNGCIRFVTGGAFFFLYKALPIRLSSRASFFSKPLTELASQSATSPLCHCRLPLPFHSSWR